MSGKRIIKRAGTLNLADGAKPIPCFVLEDGTRVISGRGMQNVLQITPLDESKSEEMRSGGELTRFISRKWFKELAANYKGLVSFTPLDCYQGNQKISGYEATALVDFCNLILDARAAGKIKTDRQRIIAEQCEILVKSFAKVGIIALVDEATGYQYEREKDELQKILRAYISEELLSWQQRFPDIFYKELFRLNGWDFTVKGIKKRPQVIGKWTNTLVYEQLPKGVLKKLKEVTPKSKAGNYTARFFQSLTADIGDPHLTAQVNQVITLFMLSDNMKDMWNKFEKLKQRQAGQLEIPFQFDEKGYTKEPNEPVYDEAKKLSDFNQKLTKALEYNSKEKK